MQVSAAEALGDVGDERAIEPLKSWLDQASDIETRNIAINSIIKITSPAADILLDLFTNSTDNDTRRAVALALGRIGDERSIELLKPWLDFKSHPIDREVAIRSIGYIGSPLAIDTLLDVFANPPGNQTRRTVAVELACVDDARADAQAFQYFEEYPENIPKAINAFRELGDRRAVPFLCKLLSEIMWKGVKAWKHFTVNDIIDVLGQLADRRAVPTLCLMLERANIGSFYGGAHMQFAHAVEALERIGDPSALATLNKFDIEPVTEEQLKEARFQRNDTWDPHEVLMEKRRCSDALERAKATLSTVANSE